MSEIQNTDQNQENTESEQKEIVKVNAYFFLHEDGLDEIAQTLILLRDYRETWKIVKKRNKYYLFFNDNRKYLFLFLTIFHVSL